MDGGRYLAAFLDRVCTPLWPQTREHGRHLAGSATYMLLHKSRVLLLSWFRAVFAISQLRRRSPHRMSGNNKQLVRSRSPKPNKKVGGQDALSDVSLSKRHPHVYMHAAPLQTLILNGHMASV